MVWLSIAVQCSTIKDMNKSVRAWFDNKELFQKELATGKKWEAYVMLELEKLGYTVAIPPQPVNALPNDSAAKQSHDLVVQGKFVEVKSRNLDFTDIESFPYPTVFVKCKYTYDKMKVKPDVVITVSQKTGCFFALDVAKTYDKWTAIRVWDRVRKIYTTAYECRKELWEPIADALGSRPKASEHSADA